MAAPKDKRKRWQRKSNLQQEGHKIDMGDYIIYVRYRLRTGKLVDFAVVLNVWHKDVEVTVARYDRAHGYTHLDVLDMDGRVDRKEYRGHIPIQQAIRHAIDDFQEKTGANMRLTVSAGKAVKGKLTVRATDRHRTEVDRVRAMLKGVYGADPLSSRALAARGI